VPPVYGWLAEQELGTVLELPMAFTPGGPRLEYQYLSTYHWQTTPDGYSGFIPPKHGQIVYEMERFPSERSVSLLQALGVRHVVVHTKRFSSSRWLEMQEALSQVENLALAVTFGADQVSEVKARSFDPTKLAVGGYFPPNAVAGKSYTAYVIVINHGSRSHAIQPTDVIRPAVTWWAPEGGAAVDVVGPSVPADVPLVTSPDGGAAMIPVFLTAPKVPISYDLVISEQEGPLGEWRLAGRVQVQESGEVGREAIPVPARLEAWAVPSAIRPGEPLPVALTWRALGKIDAYYSVYVKLVDAKGGALAGWDGQPGNGSAPTFLWVPGETIDDLVTLTVPAGAAPGDYIVEVGMYRAADLAKCLTLNHQDELVDRVVLGTVRVGP
jgi:hypothetical protein